MAQPDQALIEAVHRIDDIEAMRTRALRELTSQVYLLGDGLHALRAGRLGVAEEFMERAIAAIHNEINTLRDLKQ